MFDIVVVLAFIAVTVVGAELVRRTCRRQLTGIRAGKPTAEVTAAPAASFGAREVD